MRVVTIPALVDNYAYLLIGDDGTAVVVDPSEAAPVLAAAARESVRPKAIWLTHHHWDHVGGVPELVAAWGIREVYGSAYDLAEKRIAGQTHGLSAGPGPRLGGVASKVLEIPGHTLGAIAYVIDGHLFSGDTLFLAGCGRVFEGTMEMMASSMVTLRGLPGETRIYCGHEYTEKNLAFAQSVEPQNGDIAKAMTEAQRVRAKGEPTVPWTLDADKRVNPFLRFDLPALRGDGDGTESFTRLREAKNRF